MVPESPEHDAAAPASPDEELVESSLRATGVVALCGRLLFHLPVIGWMLIDAALVGIGLAIGYRSRGTLPNQMDLALAIGVFGICVPIAGVIFGLYEKQALLDRLRILVKCVVTIVMGMLLGYVVIGLLLYRLTGNQTVSRLTMTWGAAMFLAFGTQLRNLAQWTMEAYKQGLVLVGTGASTQQILEQLARARIGFYQVVACLTEQDEELSKRLCGVPIAGRIEDAARICQHSGAREVVIASEQASQPRAQQAMVQCLRMGCRVTNMPTFYEKTFREVPVDHINSDWFLFADLDTHREELVGIKRATDMVLAGVGLLVTLPACILAALAIKLDSRGPIIYSQERVGLHGKPFRLHKFRTMVPDAERKGAVWAKRKDPRVTRVGHFLRASRIDELPQLWNILRGQMSLVGPRPERPEFVAALADHIPFYNERHLVKPGLTGWAQINYRYGASVADTRRKLQFDLYYIRHMSPELDLMIILRTIGTFVVGSR